VSYEVRLTKEAVKDVKKLSPKLKDKLWVILSEKIAENPYKGKKLTGDLESFYSCRLTYQDRIVYRINEEKKMVTVHRARTHYGD